MKVALVSLSLCERDVIEYFNEEYELVIGLGDVNCPQFFRNYFGLPGETEGKFVWNYLRKNNRTLQYLPQEIKEVLYGWALLTHRPYEVEGGEKASGLVIFHGHHTSQGIMEERERTVISVGALFKGRYVELIPEKKTYELRDISRLLVNTDYRVDSKRF